MEQNNMTAVEWLIEQLPLIQHVFIQEGLTDVIEQAIQMEKEQLDKAYYKGQESKYIGGPSYCEQYYKETYGKK